MKKKRRIRGMHQTTYINKITKMNLCNSKDGVNKTECKISKK